MMTPSKLEASQSILYTILISKNNPNNSHFSCEGEANWEHGQYTILADPINAW